MQNESREKNRHLLIPPVGILVWIYSDVDCVLCVGENQSFKAPRNNRCEGHWTIVIHDSCTCVFRYWSYSGLS